MKLFEISRKVVVYIFDSFAKNRQKSRQGAAYMCLKASMGRHFERGERRANRGKPLSRVKELIQPHDIICEK